MTEIRRRKNRPPRTTDEVLADAKRMIKGFAKRVGDDDPEFFARYRELLTAFRQGESIVVAGLRAQGHSDQEIADGGGITRRNVLKRWPRAPR